MSESLVLRWYEPEECDEHGVPLDWERCRLCFGEGKVVDAVRLENAARPWLQPPHLGEVPCPRCGGHGSLKAAALYETIVNTYDAEYEPGDIRHLLVRGEWTVRCESCGHPMSEGTWEDPRFALDVGHYETRARGERLILRGEEPRAIAAPGATASLHYSPCDEGCKHGGAVRYRNVAGVWLCHTFTVGVNEQMVRGIEASWRPIDVRTLGWPHDLRPERLAVLCLRCWAPRCRT